MKKKWLAAVRRKEGGEATVFEFPTKKDREQFISAIKALKDPNFQMMTNV